MCKNEEERYSLLTNKIKSQRTDEEQDLINKTWHIYWSKKISRHSFVIGILFLTAGIVLNKLY